jgi:hypothetical protein
MEHLTLPKSRSVASLDQKGTPAQALEATATPNFHFKSLNDPAVNTLIEVRELTASQVDSRDALTFGAFLLI